MSYHCNQKGGQCDFANCIGCCTISACVRSVSTTTTVKPTTTNADRIRAMTDEELAAFLTDQTEYHESAFSAVTWADPYGNSYRTKQDAIDKWIGWLQQPCGGDDHA